MMTLQEIRTLKPAELHKELASARTALLQAQIGVRTRHLKDTSTVKKLRVVIAQIQTVLRQLPVEAKPSKK